MYFIMFLKDEYFSYFLSDRFVGLYDEDQSIVQHNYILYDFSR